MSNDNHMPSNQPSDGPTEQTDMPAWVPGSPVTEPLPKSVDDPTLDAREASGAIARGRTGTFPAPGSGTGAPVVPSTDRTYRPTDRFPVADQAPAPAPAPAPAKINTNTNASADAGADAGAGTDAERPSAGSEPTPEVVAIEPSEATPQPVMKSSPFKDRELVGVGQPVVKSSPFKDRELVGVGQPVVKSSPFKDRELVGVGHPGAQASYPPPSGPGQNPYPGQPQPYPGQPQPHPGQPQPHPGQPVGTPWPGQQQQQHPGTYPGQPGVPQHGVPPHGFPPGGVPPGGVPGPPSGGGGNAGKIVLIVLSVLAVLGLAGLGGVLLLGGDDDGDEIATGSDDPTDVDDATGSDVTPDDATDVTPPEDEEPLDDGEIGAEQLARSVVQIQLLLDGQPVCTGSGTVIDSQGTIVTNFHVVEQSPLCPHDQIGVAVAASSSEVPVLAYEADLLAFDAPLDLAVIRIERTIAGAPTNDVFEPVEIGDSESVQLGDELRVLGYPGIGGETVTFTTGTVSGFAETPEGGARSWLKTDATIAGGNSGGLAVDSDGLFVGIPTLAGSGSGEIVDCRIIADSNGDGRLSEEDSCVPIGGFINGIRPVSLALSLIDDAATARPIDQGPPPRNEPMSSTLPFASNPIWTSAVENDQPVDDLAAAEIGGGRLCIVWNFEDVPAGAELVSRWFVDGDEITELASDSVHSGGPQGRMFNCITAAEGLLPGVHEFAWFVNGEPVFAEAIHVGDGTAFIIEVFNDGPAPICVVQFNPTGTLSYGLNEADSTIAPGERRQFLVGAGPIDARIIDCNGDIRLEDTTGYDHNSDISLTIE